MSDYDPLDDMPYYVKIREIECISYNKLCKYFEETIFYINGVVNNSFGEGWDKSEDNWKGFIDYCVDEGLLEPLTVENSDAEGNLFVSHCDGIYGGDEVFKIDNVYDVFTHYEVFKEKYIDIAMSKIVKQYEFILNGFRFSKENDISKSKNLKDYSQTSEATRIRQESILKNWQTAFIYMVEIRDLCLKEGPKKRTELQLNQMFEKRCYKITKSQLKFFKSLLPDGYVDREGGAPKQ